jgi:flagellar hook assembly protein FlgD
MNRTKAGKSIVCFAALLLAAGTLQGSAVPAMSRSLTNYPNPFDSRQESTTISFHVPADTRVTVRIYDLFGTLVREYPSRHANAGTNTLVWDGTDNDGVKVAKGGYLCTVTAEHETLQLVAVRKIGVIH